MQYKWPLNVNNFNFLDRLKICAFFLNYKNRWTQDKYVLDFEKRMAEFVGCQYAIATSSGSTSNTVLSYFLKEKLPLTKSIVVFPSLTWSTSISPFIREGFSPRFIDVSLDDLSIDLDKLEDYLKINANRVACVFVTSLLGFPPDIARLKEIEFKYNVKIMLDNCESNFSQYEHRNISSYFTSTTSCYFGHNLNATELGFIFTNDRIEHKYFIMYRNHGMTRSLDIYYGKDEFPSCKNKKVDSRFDFYLCGNNFRATDITAKLGLIDFKKRNEYISKREELYLLFKDHLDDRKFYLPKVFTNRRSIPFSLPIVFKENGIEKKRKALEYCKENKIETRPILSGFLGFQTAFSKFMDKKDHSNSVFLDQNGFYVGLYSKVKQKWILDLVEKLNKL